MSTLRPVFPVGQAIRSGRARCSFRRTPCAGYTTLDASPPVPSAGGSLHIHRVVRTILAVCVVATLVADAVAAAPAPTRKPGASAKAAPAPRPTSGSKTTVQAGKETTLLYGDDHVFAICAPTGWVIDDTSGMGSKIRVVLYPKGQQWATATTVMYANPLHQDAKRPKAMREMIERDILAFRKGNPRGVVLNGPVMPTATEKKAEVRFFAHDGGKPHEAVAYVAEDELVMLLVLSSRSPEDFSKALPAFQLLVKSYNFVGSGLLTPF